MNDAMMLVCQLIGEGQTLALRTQATLPVIHELPSSQEEALPATEGEDEVPLVRKMRVPEAVREPNLDHAALGAEDGPSGQCSPYPYRKLDRVVADFRRVPPPPPPPPRYVPPQAQVIQGDPPAPPVPAATVQIPVDPQDLKKIPEAFQGIIYETASHMVGHAYRASSRDFRTIEERSPENVMESSMGMNLTFVLAQYRSIARVRARNDELRAELNAGNTTLTAAQEAEQVTKTALAAAHKNEHEAKAALVSSQESELAAKTALIALQAQNAQLQSEEELTNLRANQENVAETMALQHRETDRQR
ncbi:uncharacterized protein LOC133814475 [Humulus lupulus]|uniref:uncharacterized protein LOC133814475 n=1 Tax=Humulus lupulus TaxID=3486 RepID=UPI002B40AC4B|nr:uncharacterized protein LOC133814475 [Humulus lupulus]